MARSKQIPKSAVIAAATKVRIDNSAEVRRTLSNSKKWQAEAWAMFDSIPEVKHAAYLMGDVMSRTHWFVAEKSDDPEAIPEQTKDKAALASLEELRDNSEGISEIIREMAIHMLVVGECHLIGLAERNDQDDVDDEAERRWFIASTEELGQHAGRPFVLHPDTGKRTFLDEQNDYWARMWRRHPKKGSDADSPVRGILSACEELLIIERAVRAIAKSRIGNSGVVVIPSDLTFANPDPTTDNAPDEAQADPFWETIMEAAVTPVQDEGSASAVVPLILRGDKEALEGVRFIELTRTLDPLLGERTDAALKRIAQGLPLPVEFIFGLGQANHWGCITPDVEILTRDGWKTHDALQIGEEALTLNHATGLSEWQPVQRINRYDVEGVEMMRLSNRFHSSLTTTNHRWPILEPKTEPTAAGGRKIIGWDRTWTTSESMPQGSRIPLAAPNADIPTTAKWEDAFVELMAWTFTEGTYRAGKQVIIGQSHNRNSGHCARIRRALTELYGPEHQGNMPQVKTDVPMWREIREPRGMTLFNLNRAASRPFIETAPDKVVPASFVLDLTMSQLELFLQVAAWGDGEVRANGSRTLNQRRTDRLEAFELAAILTGRRIANYEANKGDESSGRYGKAKHWQVGASSDWEYCKPQISRESYTGTVWCPTLPNGTWLARSEGKVFYTGNSGQIEESAYRQYFEPLAVLLGAQLTRGYLHPDLKGNEVQDPDRFMIWYEPGSLIVDSTKLENVHAAYDRIEISGNTYRQILGFTDDDAPDEAERARRVQERAAKRPTSESAINRNEPMTAAVGVDELGTVLTRIDADLTARLHGAAEAAMQNALRRAGNKLLTRARKDKDLVASLERVRATDVAPTLGRTKVAALASSDEMLDGAWADLSQSFDRWVKAAQREALELLQQEVDDFTPEERIEAERAQTTHRADAWMWLEDQLSQHAVEQLFASSNGGDNLPYSVIREAVSRAGGNA